MDVVHPRCAGIDISKRDAKVCVRIQGQGNRRTTSTVTTWGAITGQTLALREHCSSRTSPGGQISQHENVKLRIVAERLVEEAVRRANARHREP